MNTATDPLTLLEYIIGKEQTRKLIMEFGSLDSILETPENKLVECEGIGPSTVRKIKSTLAIGRTYMTIVREKEIQVINGPEDVFNLMIPILKRLDHEEFWVLLLTTKNGVISKNKIAQGSIDAALVHPREVFKEAIIASAAGIIMTHNHPTGHPEPSDEDKDITDRFFKSGKLLGIDLLDHVIIGENNYVSLRERGLIYA